MKTTVCLLPSPIYALILAAGLTGSGARLSAASPAAMDARVRYLSGNSSENAVSWDFFCTGGHRSGEWSKIRVPSCWEQEGFGTYNYGMLFRGRKGVNNPELATEKGKYRLTFEVPVDWKGRTIRLVFDGAMTDTEAWVNGQSAGPLHQGAFYRFKYDVTRLLRFDGPNLLEVTVSKESANASVNEAERRGDYWNFGGLFRPVWLQALPTTFIDWTAIDARADGSFAAEVHLGGKLDSGAKVAGQIEKFDGTPVGQPFSVDVSAGATRATVHTKVDGIQPWTAETPNLYQVRLTLAAAGASGADDPNSNERHTLATRFGFRTFEVRPGDGLYLNGRKIVLKGVNRHSFWPETGRTLSRERCYDDARLIREMNMNAVRMSHYPPDAAFLDACDELGLYVLDELGGWHGCYDTPTGRQLIGEMVRRDVNHPSILFWDNGNEGGWNTENDGEFAAWDPQHRPVLHPWEKSGGLQTKHYRSYEETRKYLEAPDLFMPTEFLHGLYDGGHGAGLWDYWELMRQSPRGAGGFLWVFADEGVVRTDEGGRIDNQGNLAPDGIVGPHHEREGSFNTIREVWSPVQVGPAELAKDFHGVLQVENRYDFLNLDQCRFAWELGRFPEAQETASGHIVVASGEVPGPAVAPHATGELKLALPEAWRDADVLYVTAMGPEGRPLWKWSWSWKPLGLKPSATGKTAVQVREAEGQLVVTAGDLEYHFDKTTGELAKVGRGASALSFGHGPRLYAVRRGDRRADGTIDPKVSKGVDRKYDDITGKSTLMALTTRKDGDARVVAANYTGDLRQVRWTIYPSGDAQLDYEYAFNGVVDMIGVNFGYPEERMKSIRWLGRGPYRVWQNRLHGTTLDVWQNAYNDTIPGESFTYPEFKGYFRDWRWAEFETNEGRIVLGNETAGSFLGVYTPRDGRDGLLYTFPPSGLAILDVIPPVRNKVNATDLIGPSSQPARLSGSHHGAVRFHFDPR
jgi:hypothetical protein